MSNLVTTHKIFQYGSSWLRADFHLHTKADKEFKYPGDGTSFVNEYIEGLKNAGIQLGVISNHNKFDNNEFKALRKRAIKEEIFLLPGVELFINDGGNGIHTLIVFSDQWLENGSDYISPFISSMFSGRLVAQYQNERTDKNIPEVVAELEKISKEYFLVFAHVEQKSGLWEEMQGGKIGDFSGSLYETVRKKSLGFQKVRTNDERKKVQDRLKGWYPAEVEGSDCKSVEEIGRGEKSFIKLGAFSFDAVKFALTDFKNRIIKEPGVHKHSYIKSIRFEGGTLSGQELHFSPELNTIIGIRGSGKSSILEVIRHVLGISFGEKAGDKKYKERLVDFTMGSGSKVEIDAVDRYGQSYVIRRVGKEKSSDVRIDGKLQPGVSIQETVIQKPIYFGQKDLSATGEGFEKDLVNKLLGSKLDEIRREITEQKIKVSEAVDRLMKVTDAKEQIQEQKNIKDDTEHRLKFYKEHGIEIKLQKRLDFDSDVRMIKNGLELSGSLISDIDDLLARHEDDIRNFVGYTSKNNQELFTNFYADYKIFVEMVNQIKTGLTTLSNSKKGLLNTQLKLEESRKGMVEEFAEIERKLSIDLKSSGTPNISSDEFLNLKKKLNSANRLLSELTKQGDMKKVFEDALLVELGKLNELWHKEFQIIKTELDTVGSSSDSLSIVAGYKEDKQSFLGFLKDNFKGSNIREQTYKNITDQYLDFIEIYKDFENAKDCFGSKTQNFTNLFFENLKVFLTYQVPNKYIIKYRDKELQHHSLGQRASALILFVLSQNVNDLIIIDQPEDDLDNQTIYEDVIKLIRQLKPKVQFIFATHNPNIPVLGDAEQVHACSFMDDKVTVQSGSVDDSKVQKTIVNIMEGGKEAFNRRKEIYQIWKP